MNKTVDNTTRQNATRELSPQEARKKREQLLELARKEAEARSKDRETDDADDSALATFILPGD
jgi:hypothetical protein